jgi:hypothetical protein
MADFTITTTLTGNVNGRAIAVEHTYTLEDITHVVEDAGVVTPGAALRTLQTDAQGRGYHVENAPKFVAFAFQQAMAERCYARHRELAHAKSCWLATCQWQFTTEKTLTVTWTATQVAHRLIHLRILKH